MATLSGPMFEPSSDQYRRSTSGKTGGHYNIFGMQSESVSLEFLKLYFPDGQADEMNLVFFSTSGVHGSYTSLEEVEISLTKYGLKEFGEDEDYPDDWAPNRLTFLLVQPRIVGMTYGNLIVTLEDIPYLKQLRDTSWKAASEIGRYEPKESSK